MEKTRSMKDKMDEEVFNSRQSRHFSFIERAGISANFSAAGHPPNKMISASLLKLNDANLAHLISVTDVGNYILLSDEIFLSLNICIHDLRKNFLFSVQK